MVISALSFTIWGSGGGVRGAKAAAARCALNGRQVTGGQTQGAFRRARVQCRGKFLSIFRKSAATDRYIMHSPQHNLSRKNAALYRLEPSLFSQRCIIVMQFFIIACMALEPIMPIS